MLTQAEIAGFGALNRLSRLEFSTLEAHQKARQDFHSFYRTLEYEIGASALEKKLAHYNEMFDGAVR